MLEDIYKRFQKHNIYHTKNVNLDINVIYKGWKIHKNQKFTEFGKSKSFGRF